MIQVPCPHCGRWNEGGNKMISNEALAAAKAAYDIESACIAEMKAYFDDEQFAKAVELLSEATRIGAAGCRHGRQTPSHRLAAKSR